MCIVWVMVWGSMFTSRHSLRDYEGNKDTLKPGVVITVEPGLYYPDKNFGVRIEDYLWVNPKTGVVETIGEF